MRKSAPLGTMDNPAYRAVGTDEWHTREVFYEMRKRGRLDGNHTAVVDELRKLGYSVLSLAPMGDGCPDLLVGDRARNFLFELKNPAQVLSKRRLSDDERKWFAAWKGQVRKVETTEEIVEVIRGSYAR